MVILGFCQGRKQAKTKEAILGFRRGRKAGGRCRKVMLVDAAGKTCWNVHEMRSDLETYLHRRQVLSGRTTRLSDSMAVQGMLSEVNVREEMEETEEEEEEEESSSSSEEESSSSSEEESEEGKKAMVRAKTEMPLGGRKKRKRQIPSTLNKRRNTWEKEKKRKHNVREPKEYRWSAGRYKSAEQSLFEVMKDIGANPNRPVLRQELREEARKFIGDTGLLDHLLKHMSGQVLSERTERFVRRHNSEGAIEYWLERAELAYIQQQAGVTDPFWLPPPGWKPGEAVSV